MPSTGNFRSQTDSALGRDDTAKARPLQIGRPRHPHPEGGGVREAAMRVSVGPSGLVKGGVPRHFGVTITPTILSFIPSTSLFACSIVVPLSSSNQSKYRRSESGDDSLPLTI
jgi:hypothetical protein